jgi:hypothetical protein
VVTSHEQKQEVLHDFYSNLLGCAPQRRLTLKLEECHRAPIDLSALELPFTEEEVWDAIASLPSDKAPGPDGYTGRFYKTCWSIIKADLMAALAALHLGNSQKFGPLNTTYITLIPKKADPISAGDYRPISLIHSFAKLSTKVLANRLAPLLNKLVEANQSAFIRGRSIHDNYMLVQHSIKSLHRRKVASLF